MLAFYTDKYKDIPYSPYVLVLIPLIQHAQHSSFP